MARLKLATGLTLALAICGCDQSTPAQQNASASVPADYYKSRLDRLPERLRNAVFFRAIQDAGMKCEAVKTVTFKGQTNGLPTWAVACEDGLALLVVIGPNGNAEVSGLPGK